MPITDSVLCRSRLLPRPPQFVPSTGPTNYREISGPEISFQSMQRTKNILRSGRSHILHSWPNGVLEETKWFLLFRYVIEQWALTVIKFLRFFCINICYFSTRFYFFCTTMAQSSKFHQNCACFWLLHPHKTRTFSVRLYDHLTNTKQLLKTHLFNNCFNVAWLTHSQRFL